MRDPPSRAKNYAEIIKRPNFLCSKNSNEFQSWKHAIKYVENNNLSFDYFLSLPTTSPMRKVSDIDKMINNHLQLYQSIL